MSPNSALRLGRWILAACLWIPVVGCAGAKRRFSASDDAELQSPFRLASLAQADSASAKELLQVVEDEIDTASDHPAELIDAPAGLPLPRDAGSPPSTFRDLSESEMLALALTHSPVLRPLGLRVLENPAGATTVFDSAITTSDPFFGPQAALAKFDSELFANLNSQNNDRVFNNATVGGNVQQLVQDLASLNARWRRRNYSGAVWELNSIHGYDDNNRLGNQFPNYWETQLEASIRKPLMQGAGRDFNLIAGPNARPGFNFSRGVVIARLNSRISDADFKIELRRFVADLYAAYWELDRRYHNYQSVLQAQ